MHSDGCVKAPLLRGCRSHCGAVRLSAAAEWRRDGSRVASRWQRQRAAVAAAEWRRDGSRATVAAGQRLSATACQAQMVGNTSPKTPNRPTAAALKQINSAPATTTQAGSGGGRSWKPMGLCQHRPTAVDVMWSHVEDHDAHSTPYHRRSDAQDQDGADTGICPREHRQRHLLAL